MAVEIPFWFILVITGLFGIAGWALGYYYAKRKREPDSSYYTKLFGTAVLCTVGFIILMLERCGCIQY